MLMDRINRLENEMKAIKSNMANIPIWFPLTTEFSQQHKMSMNGLRKWCMKNLHPEHFVKRGRFWYIHKSEIANVRPKVV